MHGFPDGYPIDRLGEALPPEARPISGLQGANVNIVAAQVNSGSALSRRVPETLRHEGEVDPDELLGYAAYQATGGAMGFQSPETHYL